MKGAGWRSEDAARTGSMLCRNVGTNTDAIGQGTWIAHRAILADRLAFRDFEILHRDVRGEAVWFPVSGEPKQDREGRFAGYRGVARNVTPCKRAELALQVAKQAAEQANRAKSRYLVEMSHEIQRLPLPSRSRSTSPMRGPAMPGGFARC